MRLGWLFLAWMLVEIGLFAAIGGRIGVLATWAEVLGSFAAGIWLIRWQKRSVVGQVVADLQSLGDAVTPAANSALIVLAAVLLILPGFLTDALGLVLLVPFVRGRVIDYLRARTGVGRAMGAAPYQGQDQGDVIDSTAQEVTPAAPKLHKPSGWTQP